MQTISSFKELNFKKVIKVIREKGPLSRVEISEQIGISQPTISRIVDDLLKEELILEKGYSTTARGRRPVLLEFNNECYYSVGVEISRSAVKVALTDLSGNLISIRMKETNRTDKLPTIIEFVIHTLFEILDNTQINQSRVIGVGVGVPGYYNLNEEVLVSPDIYGEKEVPIKTLLEERLDIPVVIDNDANVAALAEKWFGKGMGYNNFIYILADIGIGSAAIINNDLYRGLNGEAGEISHSTINIFGEKCSCGNYGCLETMVSIPKIEEAVKRDLKAGPYSNDTDLFPNEVESITFEDIVTALNNGSKLASKTLFEVGGILGVSIANLVNIFAPEIVIIGGKLGISDPVFLEGVQSSSFSRILGKQSKEIQIVSSEYQDSVVLGAAALVINNIFSFYTES